MWSETRKQVVSRLIADLNAHPLDPNYPHAVRLNALPIGTDLWSEWYLRANGEVVSVGEDWEHPEAERVYTDRLKVLMMLV